MFSRFFGGSEESGASEDSEAQKEVKQRLAACQSYKEASILRGRYGGVLTNTLKQCKQLRDDHKKGHVIDPKVIIWTLKKLEIQKQKTFYFALLLQRQFEAKGWNLTHPEEYEVAKGFTDRYLLKWLENRYCLYVILNKLQPSEETLAAQRAAHPEKQDHSQLYLPLLGDDDNDADDDDDDEGAEGGQEGDGEVDFPHLSPGGRKRSIADVDEDAAAFESDQVDESEVFDIGDNEDNMDDTNGGSSNEQQPLQPPAAGASGTPTDASNSEDPLPSTSSLRQQLPPTTSVASSVASPPPLIAGDVAATQLTQQLAAAQMGIPTAAAPAHVLPQMQVGIPTAAAPAMAAAPNQGYVPPPPQPHYVHPPAHAGASALAAAPNQGYFPPPPPHSQPPPQTSMPPTGVPSHLPPHLSFHGRASSNVLTPSTNTSHAPASVSTALSTNTISTLATHPYQNSVIGGQSNVTDPVAQILANMQIGGLGGTNIGGGNYLAPGGPVRATHGPFMGHQVGAAPPAPAFTHPPRPPLWNAALESENFLGAPPTNETQRTEGDGREGDLTFLTMYSNSLASTFNVSNIIKTPFSGDASEFPSFMMLWAKVHRILENMKFDNREKFMILKQVLSGPSLNYVKDLPADSQESYPYSLKTLYWVFYDQKSNLLSVIQNLLNTPRSDGSFASRQKVHSALVAYSNSIASLQASPASVQFAYEHTFCTTRLLDPSWNREWVKYCSKRKNFRNPIGADVTFSDLCDNLFTTMREQLQMKQLGYANQGEREKSRYNRAAVAAAQGQKKGAASGGASDRQKANGESGGGAATHGARAASGATAAAAAANGKGFKGTKSSTIQIKEACIFCRRPNGTQEHIHAFPLSCPKVKNRVFTHQKLRDIGKAARACRLCFGSSHLTKSCTLPATFVCKFTDKNGEKCGKRHNTIWHFDSSNTTFGKAAAAAGHMGQSPQ